MVLLKKALRSLFRSMAVKAGQYTRQYHYTPIHYHDNLACKLLRDMVLVDQTCILNSD